MRLISWNLNGRPAAVRAQVAALLAEAPDVVAVQEVTLSSLPTLRSAFAEGELTHIADSFALVPADFRPSGPRRYGQLTASRLALTAERPGRFAVPWPERVLSVRLEIEGGHIDIHNTHIPPGSSNGWTKIEMLEGLYAGLATTSVPPRILCGDFNSPQAELPSGEVVTWGQRLMSGGSWRVVRTRLGGVGHRWDAGERQVLTGLAEHDLVDVYRALHGYEASDSSWVLRRSGSEIGRRFDHVFASRSLEPVSCRYLHDHRLSGLSDHSPIEVDFTSLRRPAPATARIQP